MAENPVFATKDLCVGYRGNAVVKDINITLERGRILCLIGPNGSGKSTILKTVSGQIPAISGGTYIEGVELNAFPRAELAKKLAVVLTERIRPEMMSCYEVAAMGRYSYTGRFGTLSPHDREVVGAALEKVGAADIAGRDFTEISDGQRQRVMLARAMCQEPEILLLDEPTSFLDIKHKIEMLGILLTEARERGTSIILSLHEIDLAEKVADLILPVKGISSRAPQGPEEVFTDANIARLYDIERGRYIVSRGSVELERPEGRPEVLVLGGAGFGIKHYRALQRAGIPFAAALIDRRDMEYELAMAIASRVVLTSDGEQNVMELLKGMKCVLDTGAPDPMRGRILEAARENDMRIVFSAGELR